MKDSESVMSAPPLSKNKNNYHHHHGSSPGPAGDSMQPPPIYIPDGPPMPHPAFLGMNGEFPPPPMFPHHFDHHGFYTMTLPTVSVANGPGTSYSSGACSMEFIPSAYQNPSIAFTAGTGNGYHHYHQSYPAGGAGGGGSCSTSGSTHNGPTSNPPVSGGGGGGSAGNGPSSRYSPSPSHSRGSSPMPYAGMNGPGGHPMPTVGQHAVYVHVNPGETLSVRVGNEIQHIPGKKWIFCLFVNFF
jgi:hypothetical protein